MRWRWANWHAVYASTKAGSGFKKITTSKGTSLTVKKIAGKKLFASKRYYFYVKAYAEQGKKAYRLPVKAKFAL